MSWNLLFLFHGMERSGLFIIIIIIANLQSLMEQLIIAWAWLFFFCRELGTRVGQVRREKGREDIPPPLNIPHVSCSFMQSFQGRFRTKLDFFCQAACACRSPWDLGRRDIVLQPIRTILRGWRSSTTCCAIAYTMPNAPRTAKLHAAGRATCTQGIVSTLV